jgi:hypothetical protein
LNRETQKENKRNTDETKIKKGETKERKLIETLTFTA